MKTTKMKKLLCCVSVLAFAAVGGVMTMSTAEMVDAKANGSTFTMLGGSIRLNATTPGIRFQASISDDEYQAIANPASATYDATAVFGMMIAPIDYMEGINAGDDYMVELAEKDLAVAPIIHYSQPWQKDAEEGKPVDTNWYINGSISNVRYENSNREFFGIAFMRTGEEGNYVYTYPELESVDAMSRSMSEIAIMAREDTEWTYSDDQYKIIDGYIAKGVNQANGAAQDATPSVMVSMSNTRSMFLVGETVELSANYAPSALDLKLVYESSDPSVAKVTGNTVEILKAGEAEITATVKNYGTTLNIIPATMSITAGTLEMSAPKYMAVGKAETLSVTFNGMEVPGVTYTAADGAISVLGEAVTPVKAGDITVMANVSYEGVSTTVDKTVKVIDFGNTTGKSFDLATDVSLWQYRNFSNDTDVTITYENNVADGRNYAFNALKYSRPQNTGEYRAQTGNAMYLAPEIVSLAKELGHTALRFYVYIPKNPSTGSVSTNLYMYNTDDVGYTGGKTAILGGNNTGGQWKPYSYSLLSSGKFDADSGLGFAAGGKELYLAKVEFFGADISEYASQFFTESTTAGKSMDIVSEELMGKMFTSVSNTATLTYGTGGDKETALGGNDYIKLSKGAYHSSKGFTYNQLRIEADWIQAAKKLGYKTIGIYVLSKTFGNAGTISYVKQAVDGKCYDAHNKSSGGWSATISTSHAFVSIDISKFEVGESLVLTCSGAEVAVSGVTLRTAAGSLTYFNYNENVA